MRWRQHRWTASRSCLSSLHLRLRSASDLNAGGGLWRLQSSREPGELEEGKLKVVRIGIHGGKKQERSEALSCSSAVARSYTFLLAGLRAPTAPSMPDVVDSMLDYAVWCFPHASPALTSGAGKLQTGPKDHSKSLICLEKLERAKGFEPSTPTLARCSNGPR